MKPMQSNDQLIKAAKNGEMEEVEKLLAAKIVGVGTQDKYGRTALHQAALYGHLGIIKKLIETGADPNIKDKEGKTPMHYASYFFGDNKAAIVGELAKTGANSNARSKDGKTPIQCAILFNNDATLDIVKALLKAGAHPVLQSKSTDMSLKAGMSILNKNSAVVNLLENERAVQKRKQIAHSFLREDGGLRHWFEGDQAQLVGAIEDILKYLPIKDLCNFFIAASISEENNVVPCELNFATLERANCKGIA